MSKAHNNHKRQIQVSDLPKRKPKIDVLSSSINKAEKIADWLETFLQNQFKKQLIKEGDTLPSISQLGNFLNTGRIAIYQAYEILEQKGLLEGRSKTNYLITNPNTTRSTFKPSVGTDVALTKIKKFLAEKMQVGEFLPTATALSKRLGTTSVSTVAMALALLSKQGFITRYERPLFRYTKYQVNDIPQVKAEKKAFIVESSTSDELERILIEFIKQNPDKLFLPTRADIEEKYQVGHRTLTKALQSLCSKKLISRFHGTFYCLGSKKNALAKFKHYILKCLESMEEGEALSVSSICSELQLQKDLVSQELKKMVKQGILGFHRSRYFKGKVLKTKRSSLKTFLLEFCKKHPENTLLPLMNDLKNKFQVEYYIVSQVLYELGKQGLLTRCGQLYYTGNDSEAQSKYFEKQIVNILKKLKPGEALPTMDQIPKMRKELSMFGLKVLSKELNKLAKKKLILVVKDGFVTRFFNLKNSVQFKEY